MANNAQFPGMQPLRPPIPPGPPQGAPPPMPIQFRTAVPAPQPQVYIPMASQQFQHVGHANVGMPFHSQQFQFSSVQQLPPMPTPEVQANRPPQNAQIASTYVAGLNGPRMLLSSTYTFGPSSGGSLQRNADASVQYQPTPQTNLSSFPGGAQPWLPTGSHSMISVAQNIGDQSSATPSVVPAVTKEPNHIEKLPSDWLEHTSPAGKRYYFNKKTKLSTWEKPLELMTPTERADATTDWKEHMSPEGRKYYYNRVTKQSKWKIPDEVKLAREKMKMALTGGTQAGNDDYPAPTPDAVNPSSFAHGPVSSPNEAATASASVSPKPMATSQPSSSPVVPSMVEENAIPVQTNVETITPNAGLLESTETSNIMLNADVTPMSIVDAKAAQDVVDTVDGVSTGDIEEAENGKGSARNVNVTVLGEKTAVPEPLVYENKLEARNAFKALLESANIGSDWTWDQAMRVIINDQRYGALRTLGERKQAFNEFLVQKKKKDAEERRARQKKAQEDFRKMLEESKDLTSSSRWSKVIAIFEDDERFKAVERAKDREDLFQDYIVELEKKERANALEERKWNRREFLNFLKSCDFITASSQWRKVQDRLEDDERCLRLEKIDRLEIFQEYIRDLEREEEEQMKIRMEELRKAERKNREEFRKLMEEHVASGILTPTTHWRDYCMKVKDLPAYLAVSSNTSGSTAKDLFEDVAGELQKQYVEDKARIKDAMKLRKIALSSTWTLEDFKAALIEDITSQPLSEINLKLVFDELQERVKKKEQRSPFEENSEIRRKRRKKDHHDGSNRNDDYGELRDREFGEDGEVNLTLQKLVLRNCKRLMELPPGIGELTNLEVLDLEGTEILFLPKEIAKLVNLTCLKVSFYGHANQTVIPRRVLSNLSRLNELIIDVTPCGEWWDVEVEAIIDDICSLKELRTLKLYLPTAELLEKLTLMVPGLTNFRFTVGRYEEHFISRLRHDAEEEFNNAEKLEKCLKYINGSHIPNEITKVIKHANAFFLQRHWTAGSLSEFRHENMNELKFFLVMECNEFRTIIDSELFYQGKDGRGETEDLQDLDESIVLGSLERLIIRYMKNMVSFWKGPVGKGSLANLKFLSLHTCPNLTTLFTIDMLSNLRNLEELIVEDCPKIDSLVSPKSSGSKSDLFLPSLKKISLLELPELVSISSGLCIAPKLERMVIFYCPKLEKLSAMDVSSENLKVIKGEKEWWDALKWYESDLSKEHEDYLTSRFIPLRRNGDLFAQLTKD